MEGQKKRITRKEHQRLVNKFEMEGFMAQDVLWNLAKENIQKETGELPKEEGDKPWDTSSAPQSSWQSVGEPVAPTRKFSGTQGTSASGVKIGNHCLTKKTRVHS